MCPAKANQSDRSLVKNIIKMKSTISGSPDNQVLSEAQENILFLYTGEGNQRIKYFHKGNAAAKQTCIRYTSIHASRILCHQVLIQERESKNNCHLILLQERISIQVNTQLSLTKGYMLTTESTTQQN